MSGRQILGWLALGAAGAALAIAASRQPGIDLHGKRVVIAGGSRGLGLELAREFARQGAHVGLIARDEETLERARRDVSEFGLHQGRRGERQVRAHPADLSSARETELAVAELARELGGIDVLVNNAGVLTVGPFARMDLGDFRVHMDNIFYATLHPTLAALPFLKRSPSPRIVNITSIGGRISVPHLLPYSSAKFAVVGLSEGLRAELAREGIRVTTVTPGLMRTGSPFQARFRGRQEQEFRWFLLLDSLPGLSVSSRSAARQIVAAARRGQPSLIMPTVYRLPLAVHGLAPGLTGRVTALANRLLPGPGEGPRAEDREGREIVAPDRSPAYAALTRRAARRNNQLG